MSAVSSSAESHNKRPGSTTPPRNYYSQRVRWLCLAAALGLLALSAFVAYRRPLAALPDAPPRFPTLAWWDTPLELNAAARLPVLGGDAIELRRTPDGGAVFAITLPDLLLRHDTATAEWTRLPAVRLPARPKRTRAPAAPPQPDYSKSKSELTPRAPRPASPLFLAMVGGPNAPADSAAQAVAPPDAGAPEPFNVFFATRDYGVLQATDGEELPVAQTADGGKTWTWLDLPDEFAAADLVDLRPDGMLLFRTDTRSGGELLTFVPATKSVGQYKLVTGHRTGSDAGFSQGWTLDAEEGRFRLERTPEPEVSRLPSTFRAPEAAASWAMQTWDVASNGMFFCIAASPPEGERPGKSFLLQRRRGDTEATVVGELPPGAAPPQQLLAAKPDDLWIYAGGSGLLRSRDGGRTWFTVTRASSTPLSGRHVRLPPPWFFLTLLPVLGLVAFAWQPPAPPSRPGIADRLASDKPIEAGEPDYLGFEQVAFGLSAYLRNRATTPPLTVAITGPWGGGKSSLMNLLKADLAKWGHRPVWFNAWHHESEDHLLAALLVAVRGQAIPGWFQTGGIGYRARLLWRRSRRQVVTVSLLLLLLAGSLGYLTARPDRIADVQAEFAAQFARVTFLRELFDLADPAETKAAAEKKAAEKPSGEAGGAAPPQTVASAPENKTTAAAKPAAAAVVLSLLGLVASLWRGLRTFGVDPAALLASASQRSTKSDLQAQTSFRHQFKNEFEDVTAALRPQTMTLFIDDLDRCQPEHAYKVLESVNFLMTSGVCYVVLGLERSRIERGIGLVFKDLADLEPSGADDRPDETAPARFARRYLEKLINLEVAVPVATPTQLSALLADRMERDLSEETLKRRRLLPALDLTAVWMLGVPALALGIFMACASLFEAPPGGAPVPPGAAIVAGETPAGGPAAGTPSSRHRRPASSTTESAVPSYFAPGAVGPQHVWIAVLLALGVGGIGLWRLSVPAGAVTVDSDDFGQALDRVCPLLVRIDGITPRRIKQYINRVRYFAMMRGSYQPAPPWWSPWLAALKNALRRKPAPAAEPNVVRPPSPPAPAADGTALDDGKLVALGAILEMSPEHLDEGRTASELYELVLDRGPDDLHDRSGLRELVLSITDEDLATFRRLRGGMRLSDDARHGAEGAEAQ